MKKENIIYLFIVLISLICNRAFAHDIEVKNADGATIYYDWVNNQSELKVSYCGPNYYSYDNEYFGDVVIPESVEYGGSTYSVTSIGREAFRECSDLTSVTIPNSVTSIEAQVFAECSGLISVTIPNSVTSIGIWAFSDCSSLTSVTIPKSVKTIYSPIFQSCSNLVSINVEEGNSVYDSRENCNAIIYTANNVLINGCNSTIIPNSVTSIDALAFSGCRDLTSVTIPNSVTSVGNGAFFECSGLTSVIIPNSVTSIGDNAFGYCSSLNSIYVEEGNSVYDSRNNCNAIIRTADNVLITGCNRTIIPNSVTSIEYLAFSGRIGLTSVTIPNSVTSIGGSAFEGCSGLTSVHISDIAAWCNMKFEDELSNPLYYANHLYLNGEEIKELEIPNSVKTIDNNAFSNCSSLTSVLIPNSVTSIGYGAFIGCSGLTSVHISDIVAWCNIKFGGELSNPLYYANHLYLNGEEIKDLEIPNSLTTIDEYAFCGCSGLTSVLIPNSVTSISDETFQGCSGLTSVTIPNSVTSIGGSAFEGCSGLTSVTIPNSVTSIGRDAFRYCSGITDVYCLAEIVPDTDFGVFDGTPTERSTLYVPTNSVDAYRTSWPWSDFQNIIGIGSTPDDDNPKMRTIHVAKPGTLSDVISNEDKYQIEELTLTGGLNGSDIRLIRDMAGIDFGDSGDVWDDERFWDINTSGILKDLDLSNANIVAGGGAYYGRNRGSAYADDYRTKDNSVSDYMFSKCKLSSITLPNNITSIGKCAFSGCSSLTSVNIPKGVTSIGDDAFQDCYNLTTIVSELEEPITVSLWLFKSISPNAKLIVPKGSKAAYQAEEGWNQITNIVEAGDDAPDGIMGVKRPYDSSGEYYDLSGRRILHPRKGLYIRNGKKEIVR